MNKDKLQIIKSLIKDNLEEFKNHNYELFYSTLGNKGIKAFLTSAFTELLLSIKENPLYNLSYVPEFFAANLDIEEITIPSNIQIIKPYAFFNCLKLKKIVFMGNSLIRIGKNAFEFCYPLKKIKLPNSVEYIDNYAFQYCTNLRKLYIGSNLKEFSTNIIKNCPVIEEVYIDVTLDRLNKIFLNDKDEPSIYLIKCKDGLVKFNYDDEIWELVK